ncbi:MULTISPECIES: DUF2177 family protein [unclassified Janthinobacterium]|uniref:DUF2177 family protein n=1 Tax=unclassified Janthinobacterium TaxID=2610881 RepID=UPI0017C6E58F|nr:MULTISPECIES: DUF2177 family protein [unclassified Janthinobacterium]MBB5609832.1 putative membrane protein [Janthinobacterium sp. S3T4]MBB5615098.1 putative membrane protein [Janthinobacterium sp. S3M3]
MMPNIPPAIRLPQLAVAYCSALCVLLLVDGLWLGLLMGPMYARYLGDLLLEQPRWLPAILFYLLYALGLLVFAIVPGLRAGNWRMVARLAALLGLVAYGTYDLSNYSTLQGWPLPLTLIDIAWGAVLSGISAVAAWLAASRLKAAPGSGS